MIYLCLPTIPFAPDNEHHEPKQSQKQRNAPEEGINTRKFLDYKCMDVTQ